MAKRIFTNAGLKYLFCAFLLCYGLIDLRAADKGEERVATSFLPLERMFRVVSKDNKKERWLNQREVDFEKITEKEELFLAVVTNQWPSGLIPIFQSGNTNQFELRTRPREGQVNFVQPLFFALPAEKDSEAEKITGYWNCQATQEDKTTNFLGWEISYEGGELFGRFDPYSDYRVVDILGGAFRSNHFELRAKYLENVYVLTGKWRNGNLEGKWKHAFNEEHGLWSAWREKMKMSEGYDVVALYEITKLSDGAVRYVLENEKVAAGWARAPRPLCRVWIKSSK